MATGDGFIMNNSRRESEQSEHGRGDGRNRNG